MRGIVLPATALHNDFSVLKNLTMRAVTMGVGIGLTLSAVKAVEKVFGLQDNPAPQATQAAPRQQAFSQPTMTMGPKGPSMGSF